MLASPSSGVSGTPAVAKLGTGSYIVDIYIYMYMNVAIDITTHIQHYCMVYVL